MSPLSSSNDRRYATLSSKNPCITRDPIQISLEEGGPSELYVSVRGVLVPEKFEYLYKRTMYLRGPIIIPQTRCSEGDPLFKVRMCKDVLMVISDLDQQMQSCTSDASVFDRMEKVIKEAEAMDCNVGWLRSWFNCTKEDCLINEEDWN